MCNPAILAPVIGAGATVGTTLQTIGTVAAVAGTLAGAHDDAAAYRANAVQYERKAALERKLTSIEDERTRARYEAEISAQTAELAARGVSLDSPTAVLLAEQAGREKSFASQEVRSRGAATNQELTASARLMRARSKKALFGGAISAAGTFLDAAPDLWPGLMNDPVLK